MSEQRKLSLSQIEVIDDITAGIMRGKTPAQRIAMGFNMWNIAHDLLSGYIRKTHSAWTENKIKTEIARRLSHGAV